MRLVCSVEEEGIYEDAKTSIKIGDCEDDDEKRWDCDMRGAEQVLQRVRDLCAEKADYDLKKCTAFGPV